MSRWEMRISREQVIVLWSVLAGMMVMVFLFGYQSGREEGLRVALEDAGEQAVRLPIAQPVAVGGPRPEQPAGAPDNLYASLGEAAQQAASDQRSPDQKAIDQKAALLASDVGAAKMREQDEFNFSKEEKVKTGSALLRPETPPSEAAPAAEGAPGLAGKPALEMFKGELPAKTSAAGRRQDLEAVRKAAEAESESKAAAENAAKAAAAKRKEVKPPAKKAAAERVKAEPKPAAKAKQAPKAASSGWYVQAAAAQNEREAAAHVKKLSAAGLSPVVERADVSGRLYYRVLIGPYRERAAADSVRDRVARSGAVSGKPFLKYVR